MSEPVLTPSKASLLMLGVATVALMGVPGFGRYVPPEGSITGSVVDEDGLPQSGAQVALFDDATLSLVALTRTDAKGRFAFPNDPDRFHVFATADHDERLVGAWARDQASAHVNDLDLVLRAGEPVTVRVTDVEKRPFHDAEVRVFDATGDAACIARLRTDERGRVSFRGPSRIHLEVLDPAARCVPCWRVGTEVPAGGTSLDVVLRRGYELSGQVVGPRGEPLEGMVVTGWERGTPERWDGYALTDRQGYFHLPSASGSADLRAVDTSRRFLSATLTTDARNRLRRALRLALSTGEPLRVRALTPEGDVVPARVWSWSEEAGSWSWGARTDGEGGVDVAVSARHGLVVHPLDPEREDVEVWDHDSGAELVIPLPPPTGSN